MLIVAAEADVELDLEHASGILGEELAILLHRAAAAGGVDDDRFGAAGEEGVDVAPGEAAGGFRVAVVEVKGAAADLAGRRDDAAAVAGEDARRGRVRLGI